MELNPAQHRLLEFQRRQSWSFNGGRTSFAAMDTHKSRGNGLARTIIMRQN